MEMLFDDFMEFRNGQLGLIHQNQIDDQIRSARLQGLDVWLIDNNGDRIARVVLTGDGVFDAQMLS